MVREIADKHPARVVLLNVGKNQSILDFLNGHAAEYKHFLALADDGVVWGRVEAKAIKTRKENELKADTIFEARLFSEVAELLAWKDGDGAWHARIIKDDAAKESDFVQCYDEPQMLWGTHTGKNDNGFIEMIDGAQGMLHWPPAVSNLLPDQAETTPPKRPLRLWVRHYLKADEDTGALRVVASRLVELSASH